MESINSNSDLVNKKEDSWNDLEELYPDTSHLKSKWEEFARSKGLPASLEGFDEWISKNSKEGSGFDNIKELINNIIIPFNLAKNEAINKFKYPSFLKGIVQDPDLMPPFNYGKWKEEIGKIESGGNYEAVNTVTNALGKFQFVPSIWWDDITKYAKSKGISLPRLSRSILSPEAAKRYYKDFLLNPGLQEGFMKEYTRNNLLPQLSALRSEQGQNFPHAALLSDGRIMGLFHFQGPNGARKWLRTGIMQGAEFNSPVPVYLKKIDK